MEFKNKNGGVIHYATFKCSKEDSNHHMMVLGTAIGLDTSPVAMVERGILPVSYLDKFTTESQHYKSIEEFKNSKKFIYYLPADEGHQAFRDRLAPNQNPYPVEDWQHKEWQFGWDCEEQSNDELFDWVTEKFKEDK